MITDEWGNYLIWAERCNNAAEEQYEREQREQPSEHGRFRDNDNQEMMQPPTPAPEEVL